MLYIKLLPEIISIHSLRMEGDITMPIDFKKFNISIHSLRMEGDNGRGFRITLICNFNPLPPHGGRQRWEDSADGVSAFQSTPSAWRETAE